MLKIQELVVNDQIVCTYAIVIRKMSYKVCYMDFSKSGLHPRKKQMEAFRDVIVFLHNCQLTYYSCDSALLKNKENGFIDLSAPENNIGR